MLIRGHSRNQGFTLIEVMVGIVIIAAAAVAMYYGVITARAQIKQIILQERALEELSNYMDYWSARIGDGNLTNYEMAGDEVGESVVLYTPTENITDNTMLQDYVEGTIYREPIDEDFSESDPGHFNPYYVLEAYIQWDDHTLGDEVVQQELRLRTALFRYR